MQGKLLKFGLFELNTATRQLHKQGRRVRVQEQPLRVLEVLLEQPGRLVTRQELRERLWPSDVHVDFDLGLTGAMKRLRLALGDSGDNPRFIETVPKSGYRFLAPVQVADAPVVTVTSATASSLANGAAVQTALEPAKSSRKARVWAAVAVLVSLATGAFLFRPLSPPMLITEVKKLSTTGRAWPHESLLSDGARLYYTEYAVTSGFHLHQILLNGNENSDSGVPGDYLVRALSPDHTTFLAISRAAAEIDSPSPLWEIPVIGGPAHRLGRLQSNDFAWSPDGALLAFGRDNHLLVAAPDGSGERTIATAPGRVIYPRWSPDGGRIRITVLGTKGETSIWEAGSNGSNVHPLHFDWPGTPLEGFGDWTNDGRYYVFVSRRQGTSNLWAIEETADWIHRPRREPVQLTAGPIHYFRPLPSADGKRIFALGTEPIGELMAYDSTAHDFRPYLGGRSIEHVEFSRDGQWVTYVTFPEGILWRSRADGGEEVQLTTPPLQAAHPRWSPDGKRILFIGRRPGAAPQILVVTPDGGTPEALIAEAHAQMDATWSPDGNTIVYGHDPLGENQDIALYRYDVRASRIERMPGTDGLYAPLWSRDGNFIVAQHAGRERMIVLIDLRTGTQSPLVKGAAEYPSFSADGHFVYYIAAANDKTFISRIRLRDAKTETVAEVPFKLEGNFAFWCGLTPDDRPLVVRDRGQTDVFALSTGDRH